MGSCWRDSWWKKIHADSRVDDFRRVEKRQRSRRSLGTSLITTSWTTWTLAQSNIWDCSGAVPLGWNGWPSMLAPKLPWAGPAGSVRADSPGGDIKTWVPRFPIRDPGLRTFSFKHFGFHQRCWWNVHENRNDETNRLATVEKGQGEACTSLNLKVTLGNK